MRVEVNGYCPVCEKPATFLAEREDELEPRWHANWFRGNLRCVACRSVPRERAITHVLSNLAPDWRDLTIHESSPGGGGLSRRLKTECKNYVPTQYAPDMPFGATHAKGWRNEDLEKQTFSDATFDVVVTQDVFEHLFHPGVAIREIARTLKPGGLCVMSVPVVQPWAPSRRRAAITREGVVNLLPEQFHGNPVGDGKSLVTVDWGYDIGAYLTSFSGIPFAVMVIDDMNLGVRDPYNVILAGRKTAPPDLGEV